MYVVAQPHLGFRARDCFKNNLFDIIQLTKPHFQTAAKYPSGTALTQPWAISYATTSDSGRW